jgi:hypothetical protein
MVLTYLFFLKQIGYKVRSLYDLKKQYYIGFCGCSQQKGKFVYLLLLPRAYRLNIREKLEFEKSHELSPPLLVTDREDRGIFLGRTDTRAVVEKLSILPYTTLGSC